MADGVNHALLVMKSKIILEKIMLFNHLIYAKPVRNVQIEKQITVIEAILGLYELLGLLSLVRTQKLENLSFL